jgi:polysaccharide biosynthesis protein PelF
MLIMSDKPTILFATEGSYPFHKGGVSTWSHILCNELENDVDFILLTVTGNPFVKSRYQLSANIKDIIHIPLWGAEEPAQYYNRETSFSKHIERKGRTNNVAVKELFFPMFRDLVKCILDPFKPAGKFGELLYGFWIYFQNYDYKETLSNPLLWSEYKHQLSMHFKSYEGLDREKPQIFDVTFGMRWFYHFMMPLAVPIPGVTVSHSTLAGFPSISSIVAKYEYGIPLILTDHGVYIRERLINVSQSTEFSFFSKKLLVDLSTFISRAVYQHADIIAPVTSINKKWEMKFGGTEDRIQPIYNGVDTDVFRPTAKPDKTAHMPTVVAVAQVFPLKDIETMIRSCHYVRQEIPDVQYILYGSLEINPTYVKRCKKLVKELDLEDHFTFGGFHNTPSMAFNEGDISILSSISEGFPYTVIESMSCGRPVVSTDVGGIREALEGCGELCKTRDARALSEGVIKLLKDDELRMEMGRRARDRVLINYTIHQVVGSYLSIYQTLHKKEREPLKYYLETPSVINVKEKLRKIDV